MRITFKLHRAASLPLTVDLNVASLNAKISVYPKISITNRLLMLKNNARPKPNLPQLREL